MNDTFLLTSELSEKIYNSIENLPIIDYHCHLSPKEIFEDKEFSNIGEMWLAYDHYKWRLMRSAGVDERYITGNASYHDKFVEYVKVLQYAIGHPLYHWSHMELSSVFGIAETIHEKNAEFIWDIANKYIKEVHLSPRKVVKQFGVTALCTTDDIIDDLKYHGLIREDNTFKTKVLPSFRTDNLMISILGSLENGYTDKLSEASGIKITDLNSLLAAITQRLNFFVKNHCKFSDIGVYFFPDEVYSKEDAEKVFAKLVGKEKTELKERMGLIGYLYIFLASLYKEKNIVMQMHLNVMRNCNTKLFDSFGADCGCDCVGDSISGKSLAALLDKMNSNGGIPKTVLYTLNSAFAPQMATIAGAFPNIRLGAAWWFCDNRFGIEEQMRIISENASIGDFLGMLTDSRSFLSYPRHDYFRRILSSFIAKYVENGECDEIVAMQLARKIAFDNINDYMR